MIKNSSVLIFFLLGIFIAMGNQSVFGRDMLSWESSADNIHGFRIYYGESKNNLARSLDVGKIYQYPLSTLSLKENVAYFFAVTAYNDKVESDFSNYVSWTPPDLTPPVPPADLNVE